MSGEWGEWHRSENRTHTDSASLPPRGIEASVLVVLGLAIPVTCLDVPGRVVLCKVWVPRIPQILLSLITTLLEDSNHHVRSHTGYLTVKDCMEMKTSESQCQGPSHAAGLPAKLHYTPRYRRHCGSELISNV